MLSDSTGSSPFASVGIKTTKYLKNFRKVIVKTLKPPSRLRYTISVSKNSHMPPAET